jgi:adenosyl cobinamide kinase/adenosyl cobinamide phosphate guanylyltransferase
VDAVKTLVLGGARSGKSLIAERLASRSTSPVTYLATMKVGDDVELAARVDQHLQRRPANWATVECDEDLVAVLLATSGTVLIDSLGPWLAGLPSRDDLVSSLCDAVRARAGDIVIVSDEVGLSVHPETESGRNFRDALGTLNQRLAEVCDDVLFVVAGRALSLPRDDTR